MSFSARKSPPPPADSLLPIRTVSMLTGVCNKPENAFYDLIKHGRIAECEQTTTRKLDTVIAHVSG